MAKMRVLLAYSGGLDTSIIVPWLKENYDCDVVCVAGDVGQGEELEPLHEKAMKCGAEKLYIEDLRKEFIEDYVFPTMQAGAKYENQYLRVIKASVRGLRTSPEANRPKEQWIELSNGFWGHPGILSSSREGNTCIVYSNLYMKEKEYVTKEEALEKFHTDEICLNCFCEDVFGNG